MRQSVAVSAIDNPIERDRGVPSAAAPRPRILIAEDEADMREYLDCVLRGAGYDTTRVIDGQEAVEISRLFGPFDLLLTDLVMPRMSGTELASRLRESDPRLKVLYFTGHSDQLFRQKGALWNAEAFLEKPSSVDEILEVIAALLRSDPGDRGVAHDRVHH